MRIFAFLFFCTALIHPIVCVNAETSADEMSDALVHHEMSAEVLDPTGTQINQPEVVSDLSDHQAQIFSVEGSAKILKNAATNWQLAQKGMLIEEGDQVLTDATGILELSYDHHFLDIARVGPNTHAVFIKIEPTVVKLEDGTLFNALDGLAAGESYQVSTPIAVAAVRGTRFDVVYHAAIGEFSAGVLPTEDRRESSLDISLLNAEGQTEKSLTLEEGKQISFKDADSFQPENVINLDPLRTKQSQDLLDAIAQKESKFQEKRQDKEEDAIFSLEEKSDQEAHRPLNVDSNQEPSNERLLAPPDLLPPPINPDEMKEKNFENRPGSEDFRPLPGNPDDHKIGK